MTNAFELLRKDLQDEWGMLDRISENLPTEYERGALTAYKRALVLIKQHETIQFMKDSALPYKVLSFGSAKDNGLINESLAAHQGEIRFYPTGTVTVVEFGAAQPTILGGSTVQGVAFWHGPLQLHLSGVTYKLDDVRALMLRVLDKDTIFTAEEVRKYESAKT